MNRLTTVVLAAALAASVQGCCKKSETSCPPTFNSLPEAQQKAGGTCTCAGGAATGSVWGSDIYTTDSSICAAAVHAGAIPLSGGQVHFAAAPGCPSYRGTERNGVSTGAWDAYEGSFYFVGHGDGKCQGANPQDKCPERFHDIHGVSASTQITCTCAPGRLSGSVWGSDIYTQDSSVCAAAVHAGAIPASGGVVTAKAAAGCKAYHGSSRNGVASGDWGSYDASFYFPSKATGACP